MPTVEEWMSGLARACFSSLRAMNDEATSVRGTSVTGLWWFGAHVKPDHKRPQTEPQWTRALEGRLRAEGYGVRAECRYPTSRKKCDLVIESPWGPLWIELKGAWKEYWKRTSSVAKFRGYLFGKTAEDVERLNRLPRDAAAIVGLLLVGFQEASDPMDGDVGAMAALAGLSPPSWSGLSDCWANQHRSGESICAWFWWREVN